MVIVKARMVRVNLPPAEARYQVRQVANAGLDSQYATGRFWLKMQGPANTVA